jgi:hypothetical protein
MHLDAALVAQRWMRSDPRSSVLCRIEAETTLAHSHTMMIKRDQFRRAAASRNPERGNTRRQACQENLCAL